jgi:uncharacterized membrane protein HdeD (DUF308 family)
MLEKLWFSTLLRGVMAICFGLAALCLPGLTLKIIIMIFGFFAIVEGFALIGGALAFQKEHVDWWLPLVTGFAVMILGLLTFFWPGITGMIVLILIATRFLVVGVTEIMLAVRIRKQIEGEWFLLAQGALSLCLGILLIAWPGAGALALAWLIGSIALLSGVLTVIIALRFRGDLQKIHEQVENEATSDVSSSSIVE